MGAIAIDDDGIEHQNHQPYSGFSARPRAQVGIGKTALLVIAAVVLMGLTFCCFEFVSAYTEAVSFAPAF